MEFNLPMSRVCCVGGGRYEEEGNRDWCDIKRCFLMLIIPHLETYYCQIFTLQRDSNAHIKLAVLEMGYLFWNC